MDSYCHLNLSFVSGWQKIKEVSDTSASSGVTTIIDYPMLRAADQRTESYWMAIRKKKLKSVKLKVDVGLVGLLTRDIEDLKNAVEEGAIGFQAFLSPPQLSETSWLSPEVARPYQELQVMLVKLNDLHYRGTLVINAEQCSERELFTASKVNLPRSFPYKVSQRQAGGQTEVGACHVQGFLHQQ